MLPAETGVGGVTLKLTRLELLLARMGTAMLTGEHAGGKLRHAAHELMTRMAELARETDENTTVELSTDEFALLMMGLLAFAMGDHRADGSGAQQVRAAEELAAQAALTIEIADLQERAERLVEQLEEVTLTVESSQPHPDTHLRNN